MLPARHTAPHRREQILEQLSIADLDATKDVDVIIRGCSKLAELVKAYSATPAAQNTYTAGLIRSLVTDIVTSVATRMSSSDAGQAGAVLNGLAERRMKKLLGL